MPTKSDLASALILARSEMIAEGVNPDITTRTLLGAHLQHGPGGDFDDEHPIERAFSWTGTNFTPLRILAGESIGKFNTDAQTVVNHGGGTVNSRFGFEIILDRSGDKHLWRWPVLRSTRSLLGRFRGHPKDYDVKGAKKTSQSSVRVKNHPSRKIAVNEKFIWLLSLF
jgi:hypothetical protein